MLMVVLSPIDQDIIKILQIRFFYTFGIPFQFMCPGDISFRPIGDKTRGMLGKRKIQFGSFKYLRIRNHVKKWAVFDKAALFNKIQSHDTGRIRDLAKLSLNPVSSYFSYLTQVNVVTKKKAAATAKEMMRLIA